MGKKSVFAHFVKASALLNIVCMAFVITSLLQKATGRDVAGLFAQADTLTAIEISVASVLLSSVLVVFIGTPVAYYLTQTKSRLIGLLANILYLPMVFPPAVSGLALLLAFGRSSFVGRQLETLGVLLPFSFSGVVLVQVFVTLPFYISIVSNGFASVEVAVDESARVFGAGDLQMLTMIYVPIARSSIYAGIIMCMLRAAGEFGATIMFAGNLAGKTQTVTTRIYALFQQDIAQAACLAAIQLFVFIVPLFVLKLRFHASENYS